jgi:hypothetical protein
MNRDNKGFTLIELMLAMTFIAVLLIAIAMTTIQISVIYTKGITLREVDQAGRSVTSELQRAIASSSPFGVSDSAPGASNYVAWESGGRLCIGSYTYVWNYGENISSGAGIFNKYDDGSAVRFAKVSDPGASLCSEEGVGEDTIPKASANELLSSGDRDLVLHKFSIKETQRDDTIGQALYAISMTVGTNDREQLTTNDSSCKPPSEGVGDEAYCSVNQLDIIARAGNRSGGGE